MTDIELIKAYWHALTASNRAKTDHERDYYRRVAAALQHDLEDNKGALPLSQDPTTDE